MTNRHVKIAYIGGGSRGWARTLMTDLALQEDFGGEVRLYDIDSAAAQDNIIIGNMIGRHKDARSRWEYIVANSLKDALSGVDIVVISILPGTFEEMESDVHTPEQFGILQSVGDTAGPGGILRAMRAIPMYEVFGEAIRDYCPQAFVINFSNPMTFLTSALYDVFPQVKAFGCCHEVFGTLDMFKDMLKEMKGINVSRKDIDYDVFGVNHFTWITRISHNGVDLIPTYQDYIDKHGRDNQLSKIESNPLISANLVKMDLFRRYGQVAAAGDRHLVEFMNQGWYLADRATVKRWSFGLTDVAYRKNELLTRYRHTAEILSGKKPITLERSGEEFVQIIAGLIGVRDWSSNVNIINDGGVDYAPVGAVVEHNAVFTKGRIDKLTEGVPLKDNVKALVADTAYRQFAALKAIRSRDINDIFQCFIKEPLCSGLTRIKAEELFVKMIANTKQYLGDYKGSLQGLPEQNNNTGVKVV